MGHTLAAVILAMLSVLTLGPVLVSQYLHERKINLDSQGSAFYDLFHWQIFMSVGTAITAVAKCAITQKDHIIASVLMATNYLMMVSPVQVRIILVPRLSVPVGSCLGATSYKL